MWYAGACPRSSACATAWKVPLRTRAATPPGRSCSMRSVMAAAAARVKVSSSTRAGSAARSSRAARCTSVCVLPLPGPPTIRTDVRESCRWHAAAASCSALSAMG